jgi:3-dehydroquinate synthase
MGTPEEIVRVDLGKRSYEVMVTSDDWSALPRLLPRQPPASSVIIITDEHIRAIADATAQRLGSAGLHSAVEVLPAGEEQKSLAVAARLYDRLAQQHADRGTLIVAVGGGVIGDLAGFVAATYLRGLRLLMVPTTLLAMVDSSVGGKVAVNHPKAKNLIGAFHQPIGVWIDTSALQSLPEREYRSGVAEVVKYGVILDADLFSVLESNADALLRHDASLVRRVVARCCRLKADIVARDEREETGLRMVLNYGHTFAHAFETVAGYGAWLHGEAVAVGMICASRLAERRGLVCADTTTRQESLLKRFGLPTRPANWPVDEVVEVMRSDKKASAGKLRFVLPRRLGEVDVFDDVPELEVRRVLQDFAS